MIEAGIDQVDIFVGCALGAASHEVKSAFCGFGTGKNVSRTAEDGGTGRADR